MPQYFHDRYFVPDDKDIYDMLVACSMSHDKLWSFAHGYGVLMSASEPKQMMIDEISRLPMDSRKLHELYLLNSSRDRDEKFSTKSLNSDASLDRLSSVMSRVQQNRAGPQKEEYKFEQVANNTINVKIGYLEPDFSRTTAIQTREKELTIQLVRTEQGLKIRHHSNEKAVEIVAEFITNLNSLTEKQLQPKALDFTGIKDAKMRTRFFTELSQKLNGFKRHDVPTLKVFRVSPERDSSSEEHEQEIAVAQVKRIFISGTDLTQSPEYAELEKRGFFISAMSWRSEQQADPKEHFEFSAEFTSPDRPMDIRFGCSGKYQRAAGGDLKANKASLTAIERETLLSELERAAFETYELIVTETAKALPDGTSNQVAT